jgi:hypothetical protein
MDVPKMIVKKTKDNAPVEMTEATI